MKEASLQPCDEGAPAGICWNDDRVSCPKEHQEARCLFLWNNGMTAKVKEEEKEEVQVKEEEEETSSVHFFLEQLVGDDGWRECVEVEILCPIIILEKNKLLASSALFYWNFQVHFLLKLSGAQSLGRVEDQTFRTNWSKTVILFQIIFYKIKPQNISEVLNCALLNWLSLPFTITTYITPKHTFIKLLLKGVDLHFGFLWSKY